MTTLYKHTTTYPIPPGETLIEILNERGISQSELAKRLNRPVKFVNELVKGKTSLIPETAIQLEKVLGIESTFWNNLESIYQDALERKKRQREIIGQYKLAVKFPIKQMIGYHWISYNKSKEALVESLLSFFGVTSLQNIIEREKLTYAIKYRISQKSQYNIYAILAWLRRGVKDGEIKKTAPFSKTRLQKSLDEIKTLTPLDPQEFHTKLENILSNCGIAFIVTPQLAGAPINGASRWLSPNKALIQISLRYKYNDIFWFSIFHEIGHLLLHSKKSFNIDFLNDSDNRQEERQVDQFAANVLIPHHEYQTFKTKIESTGNVTYSDIKKFAQKNNIHPGIINGRLQHDKIIPYTWNKYRDKFDWE